MTGTSNNASSVTITLKCGTHRFVKTGNVVSNGLVNVLLTSDDLSTAGTYYAQATVIYQDGSKFISEETTFPVGDTL
jgi:hypothetical protein